MYLSPAKQHLYYQMIYFYEWIFSQFLEIYLQSEI